MLELLRAHYAYGDWAMAKILDAAEGVAPDDWAGARGPGLRSIRDTFVHIVDTQDGYRLWWDGSMGALEAYAHRQDPSRFPGVTAVRDERIRVHAATMAFLDGLAETDVLRIYRAEMPNGGVFIPKLWQMLSHVAAHGVQHRSELAAMLSALGRSPGNLDQLFFFNPWESTPPA